MNDWEKIVCLILSVNRWELWRTLNLYDNLKKEKIFDPNFLIGLGDYEIGLRLKNAGYDRGVLTFMISERILKSAEIVTENKINILGTSLSIDNSDNRSFLKSLKGIGEKSIGDFYRISWG